MKTNELEFLYEKSPSLAEGDGPGKFIMNEHEIYSAMLEKLQEAGLVVDSLQTDGQLHRCGTEKDPYGTDGAYVVHLDSPATLWWQNWQTGQTGTWCAKDGKRLSQEEREALNRRKAEDRRKAEEDRQKRHAEVAQLAQNTLNDGAPIEGQGHAYLQKKCVQSYGLRLCEVPENFKPLFPGGKALTMPVYGENGQIQTLQFIREDGKKRFLAGGKKAGGFFYISHENTAQNSPLGVAEGYSTAATVYEATGFSMLVALDSGNILPVAQMARRRYPEREIVLCADFDEPSEQFPQAGGVGVAKATEAAKAIGGCLAIPDLDGQKADFNDLAQVKGHEEVAKQILVNMKKTSVPPVTCSEGLQSGTSGEQVLVTGGSICSSSTCSVPDGFYFVENGLQGQLWYQMEQSGQKKEDTPKEPIQVLLGPKLEVTAQSRDGQSEGWSKLCRWYDPKMVEHRMLIPMSAVVKTDTSAWLEKLAAGGYYPSPERGVTGLLKKYLHNAKPTKFVRQVSRSGWYDKAFVLPTGTIGSLDGEEVLFDGAENTAFAEAGTLEGWQSTIGKLCRGNSRLHFAISTAFVAPLLGPCDAESGGIVFVGDSSTGKTTCLQVGASVWGKGSESGGFLRTWRATANGLEGTASEFSDCLLCLDELGLADEKEIGEMSYMLANGQGKSRAKRNGDARKIKNWRSFILSSGEVTLKQMIEGAGKKAKAGQGIRLVCTPADAGAGLGAFEDLHGYPDAGSFAKTLKLAACENYGHAAKAFIRAFQEHWEEAVRDIKDVLSKGLESIFPSKELYEEADGQVRRVAERFLLVASAGESAIEWGIVPWKRDDALNAAKKCFSDWLDERGSVGAAEKDALVQDVIAALERYGQSHFQPWEDLEAKIVDRWGFRKTEDRRSVYYVLPSGFRSICSDHNTTNAAKELYKRGLLIKKDKSSYSNSEYLPNMGKQRCYVLTLGETDEVE